MDSQRSVSQLVLTFLSIILASLAVTLSVNLPIYGQVNKASLGGRVVDPSGAAIPQANVAVTKESTRYTTSTSTNVKGEFVFPALDVGTYDVRVVKGGFATYLQKGLILTVNQAAQLAITLNLGQVSQEVTVTGGAGLVLNTREAMVGQLIDQRRIVDLPL
ncbi:MAG: carboxypeptidase-like regulatory domain-containing protein, partial [Terriglobia bacterium]